jgi:outer membrane murein-binding lipoprotein Lpp
MMVRTAIAAAVLAGALLGGCGSSPKVVDVTSNVSIGQQLIDLKNAHDSGAITDKEYQRARKQIIDNAR